MASNNSTAKTHVSLRLPTYLLESIDAHAERESISRTEAFVHYLQTGLEISDEKANEPSADEALLMSIQAELAEIKAMLSGGAVVAASTPSTDVAAVPEIESEIEPETAAVSLEAIEDDEEFDTSDAVYEDASADSSAEVSAAEAEIEEADEFDASDAVVAPVANVFSSSYEPAAAKDKDETPTTTLSDFYEEAAAEEEAEEDFSGSDAVSEESVIENNPYVSTNYFDNAADNAAEEESEEDADMFSDSDAVYEASSVDDDELYSEPMSLEELSDAVALVAQQFPMIEKVWLFGNAATGGAIEQDTIDLCVKAEKLKSKYADLFISMIKDNTGKTANVVLRSEMEKSVKQIWKATRIDLYHG